MARYLIFFFLTVFCFVLLDVQGQKSGTVKPTENVMASQGKTRALIIGISKYQFIDSLEFADKDAQVFADYLRKNAFWNLSSDDITLLVNDKARNGDLITQLARIARASKPGDNVLFYFSGHGDVETLTEFNNGYLLAYDTYTNNYIAGALPISFLKELFVTLLNKDVKVLLITDACRSGKLAGGIKGAEFATTAISNIWKNEIKILSSQPGQLSFESPKWGNGRGVFSYYLVKGLNGEADVNNDSAITLAELEMFVGNNVAKETSNKQQPIFEGPNKYSTILAHLSPTVPGTKPKSPGNSYGKIFRTFNLPQDTCIELYGKMMAAIHQNNFDEKDKESATPLYARFKQCSTDTNLVLTANSQLLAALMNATQDIVNNSFMGTKNVKELDFNRGRSMINQVLANNDLQLPYDQHLNNFKRYFLVMDSTSKEKVPSNATLDMLDAVIDTALDEEPAAAYLLTAKSRIEMSRNNWDSAIALQKQSLEKSPSWLTPLYYLGMSYANTNHYDKAIEAYEEVLNKDSLNQTLDCKKCALNNISQWAKKLKMDKKSKEYFIKAMEFVPEVPEVPDLFENNFFDNGGIDTGFSRKMRDQINATLVGIPIPPNLLDSALLHMDDEDDAASVYFMKALQFKGPGEKDSAIKYLQKAVEINPDEEYYLGTLIDRLEEQGREVDIQRVIKQKLKVSPGEDNLGFKIRLAVSYLKTGKKKEAFNIYKELVNSGEYSCKSLKKMDHDFSGLPEYKEFMKSCKEKMKDPDSDD